MAIESRAVRRIASLPNMSDLGISSNDFSISPNQSIPPDSSAYGGSVVKTCSQQRMLMVDQKAFHDQLLLQQWPQPLQALPQQPPAQLSFLNQQAPPPVHVPNPGINLGNTLEDQQIYEIKRIQQELEGQLRHLQARKEQQETQRFQ